MAELGTEVLRRFDKYSVSNPLLEFFGNMYCGNAAIDSVVENGICVVVPAGIKRLDRDDIVERDFDGAGTNFGGGGNKACVGVIEILSGSLIGNKFVGRGEPMDDEEGMLFFTAARVVSK